MLYTAVINHLKLIIVHIAMYQDKRRDRRFEIGEEKTLVDLALQSTPESTKQKAMWAFRLYEVWAE